MKYYRDNKGIALVTALLMTLVLLAVVLTIITLVYQGTRVSGFQKRYSTALEAAKGGMDIVVQDVILQTIGGGVNLNTLSYGGLLTPKATDECFNAKLHFANAYWASKGGGSCTASLDVKGNPDMKFTLPGITPAQPFNVYVEIVETIQNMPAVCETPPCQAGNSSLSPNNLIGDPVAASSTVIPAKHYPYTYRVDIQAERAANPDERANLSGLYVY